MPNEIKERLGLLLPYTPPLPKISLPEKEVKTLHNPRVEVMFKGAVSRSFWYLLKIQMTLLVDSSGKIMAKIPFKGCCNAKELFIGALSGR